MPGVPGMCVGQCMPFSHYLMLKRGESASLCKFDLIFWGFFGFVFSPRCMCFSYALLVLASFKICLRNSVLLPTVQGD